MARIKMFALGAQLVMLLFLGTTSQGPGPETPVDVQEIPEGFVDCPTCELGQAALPCISCEGEGLRPCFACNPGLGGLFLMKPDRHPSVRVDDKGELDGAVLGLLMRSFTEQKGGVPPGEVPCNGGPDGAADYQKWDREKQCKRCENTWRLDCTFCETGYFPCTHCDGAKTLERGCLDCSGKGHLPDPRLVEDKDRTTCLWCAGKETRPCTELDTYYHAEPLGLGTCAVCFGEKKVACRLCFGQKRNVCFSCDGSGKRMDYSGKKSKLKKCKDCRGRGTIKCASCKGKSSLPCKPCDGEGVHDIICETCLGQAIVPCTGCFRDSSRSWEWAAEFLESNDHFREAGATLRIVHNRLGAEVKHREAFEEAIGYDYILKRSTKDGELESAREARAWKLAAKASALEAIKE